MSLLTPDVTELGQLRVERRAHPGSGDTACGPCLPVCGDHVLAVTPLLSGVGTEGLVDRTPGEKQAGFQVGKGEGARVKGYSLAPWEEGRAPGPGPAEWPSWGYARREAAGRG